MKNGQTRGLTQLGQHAIQFTAIALHMARLREESRLVADLLRENGPGRYEGVTVYRVKAHKVRAHWRSEHVAVRVGKRKMT